MAEPLLSTDRLIKRFGGLLATDSVSIDVRPGEIHALIGPNGAGKTTLVSQLTGNFRPDSGTIHFAGRDVTRLPTHARVRLGLARSFQITSVLREFTALDNVALAVQAHAGHRLVEQQQAGIAGQRHGDLELALLAMAECGGERVGACGEPHLGEALPRRPAQALVAAGIG